MTVLQRSQLLAARCAVLKAASELSEQPSRLRAVPREDADESLPSLLEFHEVPPSSDSPRGGPAGLQPSEMDLATRFSAGLGASAVSEHAQQRKSKDAHTTPPPKSRRLRNAPIKTKSATPPEDGTPGTPEKVERKFRDQLSPRVANDKGRSESQKTSDMLPLPEGRDSLKAGLAPMSKDLPAFPGSSLQKPDSTNGVQDPSQKSKPGFGLNASAVEFVPQATISPAIPTLPTSFTQMPPAFFEAALRYHNALHLPPVLPGLHPPDVPSGPAFMMAPEQPAARHVIKNEPSASTPAAVAPSGTEGGVSPTEDPGVHRMLHGLRGLLDFFFQPVMVQHNPYLLDLIEAQLGKLLGRREGPWLKDELRRVHFSKEDLLELDARVKTLIGKLPQQVSQVLGEALKLRRLVWEAPGTIAPEGCWRLSEVPEVRCMIQKGSPQLDAMPLHVLSFAVTEPVGDGSSESMRRQFHLEQLWRSRKVNLVCFQGLDADGDGKDLSESLVGRGYSKACAKNSKGEANTIFWERAYWTLLALHEHGSAIAVDLTPKESGGTVVRIVCLRPTLADCADPGILENVISARLPPGQADPALVVCADLAYLGGAESAGLVPGLMTLQSAMFEVFGSEVSAPRPRELNGKEYPAQQARLQDLWNPGIMLYYGVTPTSALSKHTEGHLRTLSNKDAARDFPGGRIPLVASFSLSRGRA